MPADADRSPDERAVPDSIADVAQAPPDDRPADGARSRSDDPLVVVAVCTHRRNAQLDRLFGAIERNDHGLRGRVRLGVSVADDNDDGRAEPIVRRWADRLSGPVRYTHTGSGNISVARNASIAGALIDADWVALTDDDCVPCDDWIERYLALQATTGADALTGPCILEAPPDAPRWLVEQPFLTSARFDFADGERVERAATNNSIVRAAFLRDRPHLRFDPELGVVGGEDMEFFGRAHRAGLHIRYAEAAEVRGHEPSQRATWAHQLRSHLWLGNTEYVTNERLGDRRRLRWAARGLQLVLRDGVASPVGRIVRRRPPHWRYAVARAAQGAGRVLGVVGVRLRHH